MRIAVLARSFQSASMASTLGNCTLRAHGVQAGGIVALAGWGDLGTLRDVRDAVHGGTLPDLGALGSRAG